MKERDLSFDLIKGILILLVVIGHAIADLYSKIGGAYYNFAFNAIYLWHMPLFVFVCGYFANSITKQSFSEIVKKKYNRLIIPWLIWSSVSMLIWISSSDFLTLDFHSKSSFVELVKTLYRTYTQYLWFLPCVFILTCAYYPILKVLRPNENSCKKNNYISIAIIVFWLVTVVFNSKLPFQYFEYLQITRQMIPFGMGLLYFFHKDKLKRVHYILLTMLSLFGAIVGFRHYGIWQCDFSMTEKIYSNIMLTIIMFCILKNICKILLKISVVGNTLLWLGQNSLGIYVVHMFWRTIFKRFDSVAYSIDYLSFVCLTSIYIFLSIAVILSCKRIFKQKTYILGF